MSAYAKVKLTKDKKYLGEPYKKGDVLRLPSKIARRLVEREDAEPYTKGEAKIANERKDK